MTSFFDSLNMIVRASGASPPVAIVVRRWVGGWVRSPGVRPRPEPPPEVKSEGGLRAGRARARCPVHARRQATIASGYDNTERAAYCSFALSRRWIFERNKNQFPPAIRSKALRGQCLRMVKEAKGQRPVGKSQSATCAKFQAVACIAAEPVSSGAGPPGQLRGAEPP